MADDHRDDIERLFRAAGAGVGRYVLARVGDRELAEEITARVFLAVVRNFGQLRGPAAAWLWTIVRNEIHRHFRSRPPQPAPGDEFEDPTAAPPEMASRGETQRLLQAGLARLAEESQQILYMKFFQDMRNLEIAEVLGLTPTNVGVLVHRALRQLRDHMEPRAGRAAAEAAAVAARGQGA